MQSIIFQDNIIHPLVCPYTKCLDISHAFPEWRSGEDHLWQVLRYMQTVFAEPLETIRGLNTTKELSNVEAAQLLLNNKHAYAALVDQTIEESKSHIYDPPSTDDPHYITFEQFQPDLHGPVLDQIRSSKGKLLPEVNGGGGVATGLSWVKIKEGEFKPLSIE